jgi:hypothetical protein
MVLALIDLPALRLPLGGRQGAVWPGMPVSPGPSLALSSAVPGAASVMTVSPVPAPAAPVSSPVVSSWSVVLVWPVVGVRAGG